MNDSTVNDDVQPISMGPEGTSARHAALILRIATDKDRGAFAELFHYFAPRLKGFLMRGGSSAENADELSQEALLTVWRKAGQFDPARAGASTWIYTIARNLRVDAGRRGVLDSLTDDALLQGTAVLDEEAGPDDVADTVAATQRDARVREAVRRLPDDQMQVVMLAFFGGRAHAEVADVLGLPLGTVKSRLRLAAQKLRVGLGEWADP